MNKPRRFPRFLIGSAASIARDPHSPDTPSVANVSVRTEDCKAFRCVITAREKLIEKQVERFLSPGREPDRLIDEVVNIAFDTAATMRSAEPDHDYARERLALSAAMAITALNALEGKGS